MIRQRPDGVIVVTCEYTPFPGGIGTYAGRLVDAVRHAGFSATVVAPTYPELPMPMSELDTHRILRHHKIPIASVWNLLKIVLRSPRDTILLAADIRTVLLAWVTKPIHRRAYRVMIHGSEVSKFKSGSIAFALVRAAYGGAELICANSRATLNIFASSFGAPLHAAVTYLGVDEAWFHEVDGPFDNRALSAIGAEDTVICAVGRIEPRKGQLETIRALALARDEFGVRSPVFVVAGRPESDSYTQELYDEAARHGINLIAPGRLSDTDLRRLFARSACHTLFAKALPGKIEGFGLVLLEAGAQRCPSVATRIGGIPEVMGETGQLIGPDDCTAFAAAIAMYARDRNRRQADGASAQTRARAFSWLECAQGTFPELAW